MPIEFISTDVVVTDSGSFGRTLGEDDLLVVRATGSLTSVNDYSVVMLGGASLRVEGMVFKLLATSSVVNMIGPDAMTIDVMAGGSILAASADSAIAVQGFGIINNAGSIVSEGSIAITTFAAMILNNAGQIRGADAAVASGSSSGAGAIVNSGVIRGGTGPGDTFIDGHGVMLRNAETTIVNTGTIESVGYAGSAILVNTNPGVAGTVRIENHGTIRSLTDAAIQASGNARDALFITNTGLITGLTRAIEGSAVGDRIINSGTLTVTADNITGVQLGDGSDVLRNRGVIETRVDMGAGGDFFDGRLNDQGDYVLGGAGNDGLLGGAFDDSLYGGDDNDRVFGGAGDDELLESAGQDTLFGGAGDDTLGVFGSEAGELYGGLGDDRMEGSLAGDTLAGGAGDDTLIGGGGNDLYVVSSLLDLVTEATSGGTGDVVQSGLISLDLNLYANVERAQLTGGAALRLTGTGGANVLTGNVAANVIVGGAGNDTIAGGDGADVITGGLGRDSVTGGAGADVFVLTSAAESGLTSITRDTITDFQVGVDDLRMVFMGSYIGAAGFTAAGQVRYNGQTGLLSGNTDADAAAEWTLQLPTLLALTKADFVF